MNAQLRSVSIVRTISQGRSTRFAQRALMGTTVFVLLVVAIAMSQTFTHRSPVVITHPGQTIQRSRFLEANTTTLPDTVMPDVMPIAATMSQARFLEVNTVMLPNAVDADVAVPVTPMSRQRFLEVNTQLGMDEAPTIPAYPYGEALTPVWGPR